MLDQDDLPILGNTTIEASDESVACLEEFLGNLWQRTYKPAAAQYIVWRGDRSIQTHCHDDLFHLDFFRGRGRLLLDGRDYPMRQTTLVLIPPGREHAFASTSKGRLQNLTVKFHITPMDLLKSLPVVYLCGWMGSLCDHTRNGLQWVFEEWQLRGLGWEELIANMLRNLMIGMLRAGRECRQFPRRSLLDDACRFMALHYAQPIRIEDVARECGLRADSLSRLFRTHLHTTPSAYLQTIRLNQARALLRSGYTVTEVAEQTGFSSIHYFSRVFTKTFGHSPSRWVLSRHSD